MSESGTAPLIEVHHDPEALARAVAGELLHRISALQATGRTPQICLTGGTIADAVHREVARIAGNTDIDWSAVDFWFGDERFLSSDSPDRNAGQARVAFLDAVGATRVHEIAAADEVLDAETAAARYADEMRAIDTDGFDILMLGVGPDAHVASLFPGRAETEVLDTPVVAVHDSPKPPPDRVTLTFAALNRSHTVWFLASGDAKAEAVRRSVAAEDADRPAPTAVPASAVRGMRETTWFLDRAAAVRL